MLGCVVFSVTSNTALGSDGQGRKAFLSFFWICLIFLIFLLTWRELAWVSWSVRRGRARSCEYVWIAQSHSGLVSRGRSRARPDLAVDSGSRRHTVCAALGARGGERVGGGYARPWSARGRGVEVMMTAGAAACVCVRAVGWLAYGGHGHSLNPRYTPERTGPCFPRQGSAQCRQAWSTSSQPELPD
jgi:hypothetical protein